MRVTVKVLRDAIYDINEFFKVKGFSVRLECGGRNGYQAVDEYSVHPDGTRKGSGVDRNVCCGSSRECTHAAWERYYEIVNRAYEKGLVKV